MTTDFCVKTLKTALKSGEKPEIFNTDQGSGFTSNIPKVLMSQEILISMDGKEEHWTIFLLKRFWRTIKYDAFLCMNLGRESSF